MTEENTRLVEINGGRPMWVITFSTNGEYLVSGDDKAVRVWRVMNGEEVATMPAYNVKSVAVSKDGERIAAGTELGRVIVWDAHTYDTICNHKQSGGSAIRAIDFSPDSTRLVTASGNGTASVWDLTACKQVLGPLPHPKGISVAKYSPQGDRIVTCADSGLIRVYDGRSGELIKDISINVAAHCNIGLVWSNDGQYLLVVSDGKIKQIQVSTGSVVAAWPVSDYQGTACISLSKRGEFIAYSSSWTVNFLDTSTGELGHVIKHDQGVHSIAISPDDRLLATNTKDGKITIRTLPDTVTSSSFNGPFMLVRDTVLDSWKQGQLVKTERLLTEDIDKSRNSDHRAFAYRALIRTRLQRLDAARDDAEKSIKSQPSVIGFVAKAVACVSENKKEEGCRAFDLAFKYCHPDRVDTLLAIKAVIVCMAGDYADAVSRIDDLIRTTHDDPAYHTLQAYMQFLFGNLHMKRGDYEGAIKLFKDAQAQPMRRYASRRLWTISLISGWQFNDVGITIQRCLYEAYRARCESLEAAGSLTDAINCFYQMEKEEVISQEEERWVLDFRCRCSRKLEGHGDAAMKAQPQQHDEAITRYSHALALKPAAQQGLFVKRSEAYIAKGLRKEALDDADEIVRLDPSSPFGYERKHAALREARRYKDAIDAFETMHSKMSQSSDPEIRKRSSQYVKPQETQKKIRVAVQDAVRDLPRMLINTASGRLLNQTQQVAMFGSSQIFAELVSSMTKNIDLDRIKHEVAQYYRYAAFSHTWEENEPVFENVIQIVVYDLEKSLTHDKLQMFCEIARDAGYNWAWSDNCCINKQDHVAQQEALVAMFKWYEGSALVIVFLRGVRSPSKRGDLMRSLWNTRAWTFQEYHAAKVVRFYTEDWKPYLDPDIPNHKESPEIISEMEEATGISAQTLRELRPGLDDIRQKLALVSGRKATRVEDAAYSLFGIFSVSMPVVYGDRDKALGQLLAHLLTSSGDMSILAWTGKSGSFNSCLPADITVFSQLEPPHIPSALTTGTFAPSPNLDAATRLYNRLNELPMPSLSGKRIRIPCITFKIKHPRLASGYPSVYRANAEDLGIVEITTAEDLSQWNTLYLVHPWIDFLLDRRLVGGGEDMVRLAQPGHDSPSFWLLTRKQIPALQFTARLRQPFGALLFAPTRYNVSKLFKRIAADSAITVQVQENMQLDDLVGSVRMLDVL